MEEVAGSSPAEGTKTIPGPMDGARFPKPGYLRVRISLRGPTIAYNFLANGGAFLDDVGFLIVLISFMFAAGTRSYPMYAL